MFGIIGIALFMHFIIIKEWLNVYHLYRVSKYKEILKPLGFCPYCTAGQIALWYNIFNYSGLWNLISETSLTIVITFLIMEIHEKNN
jgi:low affinity Fe/Cu permease